MSVNVCSIKTAAAAALFCRIKIKKEGEKEKGKGQTDMPLTYSFRTNKDMKMTFIILSFCNRMIFCIYKT